MGLLLPNTTTADLATFTCSELAEQNSCRASNRACRSVGEEAKRVRSSAYNNTRSSPHSEHVVLAHLCVDAVMVLRQSVERTLGIKLPGEAANLRKEGIGS